MSSRVKLGIKSLALALMAVSSIVPGSGYAQNTPAQETVAAAETNKRSENDQPAENSSTSRTRVFPPGMAIGLIPPEGMELSTRFMGFENPQLKSAILMLETPPELFEKFERDLRDANRDPKGFTLIRQESWPVNHGKGLLIVGDHKIEGDTIRKWVLLRGNPASTSVVTVQISREGQDAYPDEVVRTALQSLAVKTPSDFEELSASLPFSLRERAGFRLARVISDHSALLTDGPKDLIQGAEQAVIIIGSDDAAIPGLIEQDRFAKQALGAVMGLRNVEVRRAGNETRNNVAWHDIEADAVDAATGVRVKILQSIRFDRSRFVRFMLVMRQDADKTIVERFTKIRDSAVPLAKAD